MATEFDQQIKSYTQQVNAQLEQIIPPVSGPGAELFEAMRYSVFNGGKRVRPALCFAAAEAISATDDNTAKVAAAVEMIHAYSLIHDDLPAMDDDDLPRLMRARIFFSMELSRPLHEYRRVRGIYLR